MKARRKRTDFIIRTTGQKPLYLVSANHEFLHWSSRKSKIQKFSSKDDAKHFIETTAAFAKSAAKFEIVKKSET